MPSVLTIDVALDHPLRQHLLSSNLKAVKLHQLLNKSNAADNASPLSVSSASSCLVVGMLISWLRASSKDLEEIQVSIKWWLGIGTSSGSRSVTCSHNMLDHFGNHSVILVNLVGVRKHTKKMARNALSSTGYVSQWLWRYMELGVRRLNIPFSFWPPDLDLVGGKYSVPINHKHSPA